MLKDLIISDEQFRVPAPGVFLKRVEDAYLFNLEIGKELAYEGVVVYRKQELAFEFFKTPFQTDKIFVREIVVVQLHAVVRRVEVKEGRLPVVFLKNLFKGQMLYLHPLEALVAGFDYLGDASWRERRLLDDMRGEVLSRHHAAERTLL